jgi:hypothetical protein
VKSVNPVYFLAAAVVLMLFFMLTVLTTKHDLRALQAENGVVKKEIDAIAALKREYGDPQKKQRDLQRLLQNSQVKNFVASQELTGAKGRITLEGADNPTVKWFVQKLFNDEFKIRSLEISPAKESGMDIKTEVIY